MPQENFRIKLNNQNLNHPPLERIWLVTRSGKCQCCLQASLQNSLTNRSKYCIWMNYGKWKIPTYKTRKYTFGFFPRLRIEFLTDVDLHKSSVNLWGWCKGARIFASWNMNTRTWERLWCQNSRENEWRKQITTHQDMKIWNLTHFCVILFPRSPGKFF